MSFYELGLDAPLEAVTTIHDPSNDTTEIMAAAELQRTGHIVAPRIYSTGTILYGAEGLGYKAI